jgi:hypothetical protein
MITDILPDTLKNAEEQLTVRFHSGAGIKGMLHKLIDRPTIALIAWLMQNNKKEDGITPIWDETRHPLNPSHIKRENK